MDIPAHLVGQFILAHILAASALTFIYARQSSHSAGASLFAIFAWLIPCFGPLCFAIFLAARRRPKTRDNQNNVESPLR